jgi:hypothetical protein
MEELPEEEIEAAEERPASHGHGSMTDDELADHVRSVHGLDVPEHLSGSTVSGLHDRVHHETDAAG